MLLLSITSSQITNSADSFVPSLGIALLEQSLTPAPEAEGEQISSLSAQPIPYNTGRWNRFFLS